MFVYEEDIQLSLTTLQKGGIILYPTDTVWGIGCDATNKESVARIFELKMYSYDICSNIIRTDYKKAYEFCDKHLQKLTFFDICYIMEMLVHREDDIFLKFINLFDSSRPDVLKIVKETYFTRSCLNLAKPKTLFSN